MPDWFAGNVTANGLRIHYLRTGGEGKPVVVFNHGAMDSGLCWTPVVQALEDEFDCIMVDARGHGKSDSGAGDYSSASRSADLMGVLTALELDRPVLAGHSMGADTSIHLAATYPDKVRAIFLEDPPVVQPDEQMHQPDDMNDENTMWANFFEFINNLKQKPEDEALELSRAFNPTFPENELYPWMISKKQLSSDFMNSFSDNDPIDTEGSFRVFCKVDVPALLIIGEKEYNAIVSVPTAERIVADNSHVEFIQIAGASHNIRRDNFEAYITALKGFLHRVFESQEK